MRSALDSRFETTGSSKLSPESCAVKLLYLLLAPIDGFHGASKHVLGLTQALVEQDIPVRVLCAEDELGVKLPGREIVSLAPGSKRGAAVIPKILAARHDPWTRNSNTVIYTRAHHFGFAAARVAKKTGLPLVVELNGMPEFVWIENQERLKTASPTEKVKLRVATAVMHGSYNRLLDQASAVFVNNPEAYEHMTQRRGIDASRVHTVPLGYDPDHAYPRERNRCREKLGLPLDETLVVHVGSLLPYKGAHSLIRAFSRTKPRSTSLLFVGDGPFRTELESIAQENGVAESVRFVGQKPFHETPIWIAASDLSVGLSEITPQWGCSPTKVIEYVACGVPVLTNEMATTRELAETMPIRLVSDANDEQALESSLVELLKSDLRAMRVERLPPQVTAYSWPKIGAKAARILTSLVTENR